MQSRMLSPAYVQSETLGILPATAKPFEILMRDPEMCFELGLAGGPHLSAFHFRNDYLGVEQWIPNTRIKWACTIIIVYVR
jgi:hypothetical protein